MDGPRETGSMFPLICMLAVSPFTVSPKRTPSNQSAQVPREPSLHSEVLKQTVPHLSRLVARALGSLEWMYRI